MEDTWELLQTLYSGFPLIMLSDPYKMLDPTGDQLNARHVSHFCTLSLDLSLISTVSATTLQGRGPTPEEAGLK